MIIPAIPNWNHSDLVDFLNDPNVVENDVFEFKVKINFSDGEEIRKDFSAFANSKGGYFFIGIDNHKNIVGIEQNLDLLRDLNRVLSSPALNPKVSFEQIACIEIPSKTPPRFIYVIHVPASLNHKKPHVSHEKVFYREQGEIKTVASGERMRDLFLMSTFQPENINQLEHVLKKLKLYQYGHNPLDHFEILYLRYLCIFLDDNLEFCTKKGNTVEQAQQMVDLFKDIRASIDGLIKHHAQSHSISGSPTLALSDSAREKSDLLAVKVEEFLIKFKAYFQNI